MPQIRIRDGGGTLRTITRIRMRDAGNVLRDIQKVTMRDAGAVARIVFSGYTVVLSSYNEYMYDATPPGVITTAVVNSTVVGGVPAYTYAWEYVSGSLSITATAPAGANSAFSANMVGASGSRTAVFRLKVTDSLGEIRYSPNVNIELEWG